LARVRAGPNMNLILTLSYLSLFPHVAPILV